MRKPIAFIGYSGAGKTTLITALVRRWVARGESVGVIKHTHHLLDELGTNGDAERYLVAGASAVALADDAEVVIARSDGTRARSAYARPGDLPALLDAGRIVIEGFKRVSGWPRIAVDRPGPEQIGTTDVVAVIGSEHPQSPLPQFHRDDLDGIAAFIERICDSDEA